MALLAIFHPRLGIAKVTRLLSKASTSTAPLFPVTEWRVCKSPPPLLLSPPFDEDLPARRL
jgi:hypothetical protein